MTPPASVIGVGSPRPHSRAADAQVAGVLARDPADALPGQLVALGRAVEQQAAERVRGRARAAPGDELDRRRSHRAAPKAAATRAGSALGGNRPSSLRTAASSAARVRSVVKDGAARQLMCQRRPSRARAPSAVPVPHTSEQPTPSSAPQRIAPIASLTTTVRAGRHTARELARRRTRCRPASRRRRASSTRTRRRRRRPRRSRPTPRARSRSTASSGSGDGVDVAAARARVPGDAPVGARTRARSSSSCRRRPRGRACGRYAGSRRSGRCSRCAMASSS